MEETEITENSTEVELQSAEGNVKLTTKAKDIFSNFP